MAYLFVITMCTLALLFIVSKVAGDIITWLVRKIVDPKGVDDDRTDNEGTA